MKTLLLIFVLVIPAALIAGTPLAGTYFLDQNAGDAQLFQNGGRYFTSFNQAVDTLHACGVSDSVLFEVAGGQVFPENVQIDFPFPGASRNNHIEFRGVGSSKPVVQPVQAGLSPLVGVFDVRFDGDYFLTLSNLKIVAQNGGLQYKRGVRVIWGADHVTVADCEILDFSHAGVVVYFGGGDGYPNDGCESISILNNDIYSQNMVSSAEGELHGIWINGGDSVLVSGNRIHDLGHTTSLVSGVYSIGETDTNFVDIYNNMISLGATYTEDVRLFGIYTAHMGGAVNVSYNTVELNGLVSDATNYTSAARLFNTCPTVVRNNIFVNRRETVTGSAPHYALHLVNQTTVYDGDYNDFYTAGPNLNYRNTAYGTIADWQNSIGYDTHSMQAEPLFTSSDDLHLTASSPVLNAGIAVAGLISDIDGDLRSSYQPDMGADEFFNGFSPAITSVPVAIALEDELYQYSVTAEDPQGNAGLDFSMPVAPAFLAIDSVSGVVSGTPDNDDVGYFTVRVEVSDADLNTDFQQFILEVVNVNDVPELHFIHDVTVPEDEQLIVNNIRLRDVDSPVDTFLFEVATLTPGLLPLDSVDVSGMDSTRQLVVKPVANGNGAAYLVMTLSDGELSMSDTLHVEVTARNDIPVVRNNPFPLTISQGDTLQFFLPDSIFFDIDAGDSLRFSVQMTDSAELPQWLTVDPARYLLTGIPANADTGSYNFLFHVMDDSGATASVQWMLIVLNRNDPPFFTQELPAISGPEDQPVTLNVIRIYEYIQDPDMADTLLSVMLRPGIHSVVSSDGEFFQISPDPDWFGSDSLMVVISDGEFSDSTFMYYLVSPVNDAPLIIDLPDSVQIVNTRSFDIDLSNAVVDRDSLDSHYWQFSCDFSGITLEYSAAQHLLRVIPDSMTTGSGLITCIVTDDSAASDTAVFTIDVISDPLAIGLNGAEIPVTYQLYQNYPNPFNPVTHIRYALPVAGQVRITVYNINGQLVKLLHDEFETAGYHMVRFDPAGMGSGTYFCVVQSGNWRKTIKMIYLR